MLRYLAVSSAAVLCLLTAAAAPAEAGQSTGTWKYWSPEMAQPATPHWPHGGGYGGRAYGYAQPATPHWHHGGRGYGHLGHGYSGYPQPPYRRAYGYRHAPGW